MNGMDEETLRHQNQFLNNWMVNKFFKEARVSKAIGSRSAEDERKVLAHEAKVKGHRAAKRPSPAATKALAAQVSKLVTPNGTSKPLKKLDRSAA